MRTQSSDPKLRDQSVDRDDALAFLSAEHQQIAELFELFEEALESNSAEQKPLSERICIELEIHSQLEEEIFYPTIAREASIKPLVGAALKDHAALKDTVQRVRTLEVDDPDFGVTMLQLMEDVEDHVDEEENVMFAEVEKRLLDELEALGTRLENRKQELLLSPTRASSGFPSSGIL